MLLRAVLSQRCRGPACTPAVRGKRVAGVSHCPFGETVPLGLVRGGVVRAGNASKGLAGAIPPDADGRHAGLPLGLRDHTGDLLRDHCAVAVGRDGAAAAGMSLSETTAGANQVAPKALDGRVRALPDRCVGRHQAVAPQCARRFTRRNSMNACNGAGTCRRPE
jgi:hypothetical protein